MKTHMLLVVALGLAVAGAGAQDKPDEPAEKRVVGKDGKTYYERVTPFGTAKRAEKPEEAKKTVKKEEVKQPADANPNLRAIDEGDTVRFESRLPFGVSTYRKKKNELNEVERAALERQQKKSASK